MSDEKCTCPKDEIPWHNNPDCPVLKAESSFAAPTLLCDIESAVVNGRKIEGEELRKFIEGMSEQDRRTMIVDMGLVDMLKDMADKQKGPTPCSHCGGNGYEP